jgi:hypothetical protein
MIQVFMNKTTCNGVGRKHRFRVSYGRKHRFRVSYGRKLISSKLFAPQKIQVAIRIYWTSTDHSPRLLYSPSYSRCKPTLLNSGKSSCSWPQGALSWYHKCERGVNCWLKAPRHAYGKFLSVSQVTKIVRATWQPKVTDNKHSLHSTKK